MKVETSLTLDEKCSRRIEWKYLCYGKNKTESKLQEIAKYYYPNGTTLLDIGCGGGGFARHFNSYIGIDINFNALIYARQSLPIEAKHIFICGDATGLPLRSSSIVYFVCNSMLEHTKDPLEALKEIYRVCQKGGIFIIPCRDRFSFIYDPLNYVLIKSNRKPINFGAFGYGHCNVLTFDQWSEQIERSGFEIEDVFPFDNSLFAQIEFLFFSVFLSQRDYRKIPTRTIGKTFFEKIHKFHKIIGVFDINTKKAFSQCFIVSKNK